MESQQLSKLRKLIAEQDIGYYLVLTQDAHNSEYVSPSDKRREYVTGFTGSAGTAVIGKDGYNELATDGRYWIQAEAQLGSEWVLRKEGSNGVVGWIEAISARSKAEKVAIGVDPKLISYQQAKTIMASGATLKPIETNLVDLVWRARPAEPAAPVFKLNTIYSGQTAESKIVDLRQEIKRKGADAIVISALDQIAWLLNLRGSDIDYNPVFKSYLIVTEDEAVLYISNEHSLPSAEELGDYLTVKPYDSVFEDINTLSFTMDKKIWIPPNSSWALVRAAGVRAIQNNVNPVEHAKSIKNAVELSNAYHAHLHCGLSITRLLSWIQQQLRAGHTLTEYEASEKLLWFRQQLPNFMGQSFESISSSGPNAAIIHYAPPAEGSRKLSLDEGYLIDSGCQFLWGTTDTTRTAWFGENADPDMREAYTLVLKGHIALAQTVFKEGTPGYALDMLARAPMNKYGYDYSHGTGHGVGAFLNVHEGPCSISPLASRSHFPIEAGNIISDEPGIYIEDRFGIRIENLLAVEQAKTKYSGGAKFLRFRALTLVPYAYNLIDPNLLSDEEITWLNEYSQNVRKELEPHLEGSDLEYLHYHTQKLSR